MDLVSVTRSSPVEAKIALFRSLFRGRVDVYPRRFESRKTGRSGYAPMAECIVWVRKRIRRSHEQYESASAAHYGDLNSTIETFDCFGSVRSIVPLITASMAAVFLNRPRISSSDIAPLPLEMMARRSFDPAT
jgi:hypothetical protein